MLPLTWKQRQERMLAPLALAAIVTVGLLAPRAVPAAETAGVKSAVALAGTVSSTEEGPMEGVLVSAKKANSTISVTVVSDDKGRYQFPASRLEAGQYSLRIRAAGYDVDDPGLIEIGPKSATADLKLHKAKDLAAQLTNAEWMMSMTATDAEKNSLLNCVQCHTLERILRSKHTPEEFSKVLDRMGSYANQSFPLHLQKRKADRLLEERGEYREKTRQRLAEFLARVNLSTRAVPVENGSAVSIQMSTATWPYSLQTLPRPKGRATHVIITEYDLPRKTVEPHDVALDAQGNAWYSNFGEQAVGELDPKTGKVTEFSVPILKPGFPTGELGMQMDPAGNFWFGMMFQGGVAKLDPKTREFQTWNAPAEFNRDMTQINMAAPQHSTVDGKVWTQNNGFAVVHRIDLATGKIETFEPFKNPKEGENHNIYDVIPDSHNNAYFTDFANEQIGRIDAKTGEIKLYNIPTKGAAPRRGQMDTQDRVWFGEYKGNKVGMFDPKTEKFMEWTAPTAFSAPYDVQVDKNGDAWTGSMTTDRVLRLDPKSGKFTEYMLPRSTNIRRVYVDNTTTPPSFWVGNNHGASIVKVEPLD
jgi:virginiamycin B lyase